MNINRLRCGECGHRGLEICNVHGKWGMSWHDFPKVIVQEDLNLPVCPKCGNVVIPGDSVHEVDAAIEKTVLRMTRQFLEQIKEKSNITYKNIGALIGVSPEYISMLLHEKKRPSYQLVQLLKLFNLHPELMQEISE